MTTDEKASFPGRDHASRSMSGRCARCDRWSDMPLDGEPPPMAFKCERCGKIHKLSLAHHLAETGHIDGCPMCGYHTLCVQKDVNQRLGVIIVVVVFAALLFSGIDLVPMLGALVVFAIVDFAVLMLLVKRVLICYRCKTLYRGFPPGESCRTFDLATWEAHTPPPGGASGSGLE